ncbi:MAG: helix-turn-helix transcriptional regulator [Clostridiales bacterium]|nr:helix-turn-helix transcriptional regulator [Clostridiales bacterium]
MVDTLKIKAIVVERGMTQTEVAKKLGMSNRAWFDRMRKKKFDSEEMYNLIRILDISNPTEIFFADEVTR